MVDFPLPDSLFSEKVFAKAYLLDENDSERAFPGELPVDLQTAPKSRKIQFLASRCAMREALKSAGTHEFRSTLSSEFGPDWPVGVVGSVSHSKGLALAAVSTELRGIGVDVEILSRPRSQEAIEKKVLSETEKQRFLDSPRNLEMCLLIFSAKESLFKCLSPSTKEIFWFDAAEVRECSKSNDKGEFLIEVLRNIGEVRASTRFHGRFAIESGFVLTAIEWV